MRYQPDLTGTGPIVTDLATGLTELGDDVTVVTSMPHYGRKEVPSEYKGRLFHRQNCLGVDVRRTFVYVPPNPGGFHRGMNYLSYTLMCSVIGLLSGRHDVVLCVNPPITVGFAGFLIGLIRRMPVVFNVQDVWPDCLETIGQLRNPLLIRIFRHLETFIYRISARVTVLSDGMRQNLVAKGVEEGKILVIPNWADVDQIRPVRKKNNFRGAHNLNGHFVVMFAGNLGYVSALDTLLDAAKVLQYNQSILFLVVGEGNAKAGLQGRAKRLGLKNVRFLPRQPKENLSEMLGAADVSLVSLHRHLGQLNVPSKTYSIMASARPVIAAVPGDSEIARLVRETDCGVLVPPQDPEALAATIDRVSQNRANLEHMGANGRRCAVTSFDKRTLISRYRRLLQQVSSRNR